MRSFYQDRLGTNIGKALKNDYRFLRSYNFHQLELTADDHPASTALDVKLVTDTYFHTGAENGIFF